MSKSISGNQKHLTLSDRCFIEQALLQGLNFRQMAITLEKDPSTISKEIRLHRNTPRKNSSGKNDCIYAPKCDIYHICGNNTCMKAAGSVTIKTVMITVGIISRSNANVLINLHLFVTVVP